MKQSILLPILLILSNVSVYSTRATTTLGDWTQDEIPMEITADTLPSGASFQDWRAHAGALYRFTKTRILRFVPKEIKDRFAGKKVVFAFTYACPNDGLFIDPKETGGKEGELYICIQQKLFTSADLNQILAHEFFHALHYIVHPDEPQWVREGLALWFDQRVMGSFNHASFRAGMVEISTPLEGEFGSKMSLNTAQYGHDLLYFYYLWSKCGGDDLIWKIAKGKPSLYGAAGIDSILKEQSSKKHECSGFEQSALTFEVARAHNRIQYGKGTQDDRYSIAPRGYLGPSSVVIPLATLPESFEAALRFTPFLLKSEVDPHIDSEKAYRYWLEKQYPFRVLESEPEKDPDFGAHWLQLIIRK